MPKPQTGAIYTLTDPRDDRIRYVGQTRQDPLERLAGHMASASNPAMRVWLHALALQGLTPRIAVIAEVAVDEMNAEEQRQIKRHAEAGHRLFNAPYYRRHIADLYQAAAPTPAALKRDDKIASKVDEYAHRVYGEVAAASAAGTITRGQAAVGVIARAPAVAIVLLWHTLAGIAPLRWAVKAGFVGSFLWGPIGFDRLARDKLLPFLPMHQWIGFWHSYLERPAISLCVFSAGSAVLTALAAYASVRESAGVRRGHGPHPAPAAAAAAAAAAPIDGAVPSLVVDDLKS